MAHTAPTAAVFKARHPRFAAVGDDTVALYLAEAGRSVTTAWSEDDYADGIMYLAAHLMFAEGALDPTGAAPGTAGQVKKVKAGEVEAEFAVEPGRAGMWSSYEATIYGRRYLELASRNGGQPNAAILVV